MECKMSNQQEVSLSELRENLSDLINESAFGKKRIVLNRRGKRMVAIIPIEDLEDLEKQELKKKELLYKK